MIYFSTVISKIFNFKNITEINIYIHLNISLIALKTAD